MRAVVSSCPERFRRVKKVTGPVPPPVDVYADLVREASGGDPAAMERLLTRVQEVAWRFSVAVCGHADDAEDAMQEALLKTYRYTSSIREPEAFRPWLHRTVRNACLMNRRKRVHEPRRLESLDQPHADDAEDAMQEALLKTYRYTSTIREPEAFRPWLHRTVKNACLMNRRKRAHEPPRLESLDHPSGARDAVALDPPDPGRNPEQLAANTRLRGRLQVALRGLPPSQRAIVFLREMQGLSTRDVAHAMGISEDNVKTRLSRARKALQAALETPAR